MSPFPWKTWLRRIAIGCSVLLNLVFVAILLLQKVNAPTGKIGVLREDITAGNFLGKDVLFKLPKGLTVRDESPQGIDAIGMFEAHRFVIVLTTDRQDIVDYQSKPNHQFNEFYSVDNRNPK